MWSNKPQDYLSSVIVDDTVTLQTRYADANFKFFGSSVKANVVPKKESNYGSETSVTFYLEPGQRGIIAVSIPVRGKDHKGRPYTVNHLPVFLTIGWKMNAAGSKKIPVIDLDNPWISSLRVGHISSEGITAMVRGLWVSTWNQDPWRKPGNEDFDRNLPIHLPEGNLLCKYLFGEATSADVLHAMVQRKLEPVRQKTTAALVTQVRQLTHANTSALRLSEEFARDNERLQHDNQSTAEAYGELYADYSVLRTIAKNAKWLSDLLSKQPFARLFGSHDAKQKAKEFIALYDEAVNKPALPAKIVA